MKTYKGRFKPKNKEKYKGDINAIEYRSSWELKYMLELDTDPMVLEWSSESIIVPYISPIDNRKHRYFPDFWVKRDTGFGIVEEMIEIKPKAQTKGPKVKDKPTKRYINEVRTWGVNSAKWAAAEIYCESRNWDFIILTEDHLNVLDARHKPKPWKGKATGWKRKPKPWKKF